MASLKQPPVFNPDDGDSYQNWKADVEVWRLLSTDTKIKQGPAVYLSLHGDAREACRSIPASELAENAGIDKVLKALDSVFLKDETTRAFCAIRSFIDFRREGGQSYPKFLVEFNTRHREVMKYKLKFDDGILAYFLLAAANISEDHERLVRATSTLTFDDMKDKLQKVFGEFGGDKEGGTLPLKEDCLYTGYYRGRGRGYQQQGTFQPRGSFSRDQWGTFPQRGSGRGRGQSTRDNPYNQGGTQMRCHECESTKHFVSDCPHRSYQNAKMLVNLTLVTGDFTNNVMMVETLAKAILDTACTKTVAGQTWMNEYLSLLPTSKQDQVKSSKRSTNTLYRFGDGVETKSKYELELPINVCGKMLTISVDVVDSDIPLLLSRPTMTELGMILNTKNHTVEVDGHSYKLQFNPSGHYVIPVSEWTNEDCKIVLHMENLETYTKSEKRQKALKLHRQFAHASKERLLRLLKNGGCTDLEFMKAVEKCCEECQFCQKYRKPKPKPIVGLPKAEKFNEVVSMDLKEVEKGKIWILHLVDSCTRYTATALIKSKRKEVIVKKIFKIWLAYFGAPLKFHSDNGGEFANETFREMNEKMGIETSTTPAESPFSNGVVERNNAMLYETMMKTMEDQNCDMETALAWATCAKNSLQSTFGFSPNQLVLGRNVNLPSVESNDLPAQEPTTHSDLVRTNLNALHKSRENYIKAESSDRIKRALKHNIRTYSEVDFLPGEKVYFKRNKVKGWKGPAKVLGKESNFVLIRHGSAYYRCHPCHMKKVNEEHSESSIPQQVTQKQVGWKEPMVNRNNSSSSESSDEEFENGVETDTENGVETDTENGVETDTTNGVETDTTNGVETDTENGVETDTENGVETDTENGVETDDAVKLNDCSAKPTPNTVIQYALKDGTISKSRVLSTQPKRTGVNKQWVNVQVIGMDEPCSIKWDDILWWRMVKNTEKVLTLSAITECNQDIVDAKEKELQNLIENDVFEWVVDEGQKAISSRWVIHEKVAADGSK